MLIIKRFYLHNSLRNYNYCLVNENNQAIVIDPTDAQQSIRFCIDNQIIPSQIWITHEDLDHFAGADAVSEHFNIPIHCPAGMKTLFKQAIGFNQDDVLSFNQYIFSIKHLPGHTPLHHVFLESNHNWLISGDIVFNYGMGRVRANHYKSMFDAIQWLKTIKDDCKFLNAHDYDLTNLSFAQTLQPNNKIIKQTIETLNQFSESNRPMSTIGAQKQLNPFFNTDQRAIIDAVSKQSMPYNSELDVFTSLRKWRDHF
ncbi:hydroxyacylglutathione hydrolase C-terminal domain-containing protein [Marinicellulosiphila megalodicopiae]|uniref:hydroxyacylglutathione hydrolase C-terminal domain-containing protein n=1 Tax=Marinicellulosiphila megalodicopiae TaxID=2724896 RepID=UPI003BB16125